MGATFFACGPVMRRDPGAVSLLRLYMEKPFHPASHLPFSLGSVAGFVATIYGNIYRASYGISRLMPRLAVSVERFPILGNFVISRGAKAEAAVVVATIEDRAWRGRGEGVPYARYGETVDSVLAQMGSVRSAIEAGADRVALQTLLPPGAARNALDCALWDLAAKRSGVPAHVLAGVAPSVPVATAFTISVGTPDEMARAAAKARARPLLKIKLAGEGDAARLVAVRAAAPEATLIVDANEAWAEAGLERSLEACAKAGVALVEQPLPAGRDSALAKIEHVVPICADESIHDRSGLEALRARYDAINVKLDKTGGLTEALALMTQAEGLGYELMIGCMVASSLAMAPALLLAAHARFVDLDGPLLLARDRPDGLVYEGSIAHPPARKLWG
jgi:L-alanine-DL-glutamate epimerase-like enolase superfamily enzyme